MALTTAQKLVIALGLLVLLAGVFILSLKHTPGGSEPVEMLVHGAEAADTMVVHVVGQVQRPGLYRLPVGGRVADAVKAAGGFTEQADTATVNLARVLDDGEQITVGRLPPAELQPHKQDTTELSQPDPYAGQHPDPSAATSAPAANPLPPRPAQMPTHAQPDGRVSLNRAGLSELEQIPGIGPELARRILYYRHQRGGFSSVEQLLEIQGIGRSKLDQIRPHVTL